MDKHEMKVKIADFAYEEKICVPQAFELDKLVDEGYDVTPALAGRILGFSKTRLMCQYVKEGNVEGINQLIKETEADDKFVEEFLPEMQEYMERNNIETR
jgi:hypothetical protein